MSIFLQKIKNLLPAYFAMVMATGIVSIASYLNGFELFAYSLFYLNLVFLGGLSMMFLYRCLSYSREVLNDFRSYVKGPGFFTIVAALCIIGNQFIMLTGNMAIGNPAINTGGYNMAICRVRFLLQYHRFRSKKTT